MADPLRERIAADAALGALRPLTDYERLFPGREPEVAAAWRAAGGGRSSGGSGPHLEDATRGEIGLEALRVTGHRRLELGEPIGAGGMGEVLAARDAVLRRPLALKRVLGGDAPAGSTEDRAPLVKRLLEEAQITAQLDHPGVVPVHELGVDDAGRPYFTMKRVHGHTLADVFRRDREGKGKTLPRTLQVFLRLCETLAYAHRKGVVHRDVKPANVMVGRFGEVYLMDWGLAKLRGDDDAPADRPTSSGATEVITTHRSERLRQGVDAALTMDDQVVGTLGYLAPEQLVGAPVDARTDIYAVGAMLYELLAGHPPYCDPDAAGDFGRMLTRMMKEPPTPLATRAPDAPAELVAITEKALARDPDLRFANAQELAEDLHAFLEGRVVRSHRTGLWIELRKWVGRNRWLAAGIVAVTLATIAATLAFAAQQRRAAVEIGRERDRAQSEAVLAQAERRRADGLRLAALSRLQTDDPGLALALAVEASRRAPSPAATSAVLEALRRHRELRCFFGHESYLSASAWTSDGARLVTGDEAGLVVVWDVAGDAPLHWLDGATEPVVGLAVEPGDRRIAVVHDGGPVRVWDMLSGREARSLAGPATSATFLAPERLVVAGVDGTLTLHDLAAERATVLDRGPGPTRIAAGLAVGGTRIAATGPKRLVLVEADGGTPVVVAGPDGATDPRAVVCAALGEVLVRWGPTDVRTYDLASGEERRRVGGGGTVTAAAYAADGSRLALGVRREGGPARVEVTDARSGAAVASLDLDASVALLVGRDGGTVVAVDRTLAVAAELGTAARAVTLRGHRYTVAQASLSPDGTMLATASHDMTARVWALRPESERRGLVARAAAGHRVLGWSDDGSRALVALPPTNGATTLEVVESKGGTVVARFEDVRGEVARGGLDATGGQAWWLAGRSWRVMDVATGATVRAADLAMAPQTDTAVWPSPDGQRVAAIVGDGLAVFDQASGVEVGRVAVGRAPMRPMWAPDAQHLIVAFPPAARSALFRFDVAESQREFTGHTGFVTDARVDATGRWVVSVAADTTARVFDAATGRTAHLFRGLPMRGARLAMGPRGDRVAITSSKLFLLRLLPEGRLEELATLDREAEEVLNFHPDGQRCWLLDAQQRVRFFDLDAAAEGRRALRRPILPVDGVTDYVADVDDPLDATWYARPDAWWSLERAERSLSRGAFDDADRALADAERQRPAWAAAALCRVRLAAARATAAGTPLDQAVPVLLERIEAARRVGADRVVLRRWNVTPAELERYVKDPQIAAALLRLQPTDR